MARGGRREAVTKDHQLGGWKGRDLLSHGSGGQKSGIRMPPQAALPLKALGARPPAPSCSGGLGLHRSSLRLLASLSSHDLLTRNQSLDLGPPCSCVTPS